MHTLAPLRLFTSWTRGPLKHGQDVVGPDAPAESHDSRRGRQLTRGAASLLVDAEDQVRHPGSAVSDQLAGEIFGRPEPDDFEQPAARWVEVMLEEEIREEQRGAGSHRLRLAHDVPIGSSASEVRGEPLLQATVVKAALRRRQDRVAGSEQQAARSPAHDALRPQRASSPGEQIRAGGSTGRSPGRSAKIARERSSGERSNLPATAASTSAGSAFPFADSRKTAARTRRDRPPPVLCDDQSRESTCASAAVARLACVHGSEGVRHGWAEAVQKRHAERAPGRSTNPVSTEAQSPARPQALTTGRPSRGLQCPASPSSRARRSPSSIGRGPCPVSDRPGWRERFATAHRTGR
jgi:hypothetical protein